MKFNSSNGAGNVCCWEHHRWARSERGCTGPFTGERIISELPTEGRICIPPAIEIVRDWRKWTPSDRLYAASIHTFAFGSQSLFSSDFPGNRLPSCRRRRLIEV
jgi:hypothetical protein